ncbi:hypothetical protein EOE48_04225 [Methylobacterium oryzihabitans]|uniref:Uncharacterized protein n=1 Tax=Methylobacterium oryzihabitans TaxID=2499852 RepID=A0A437PE61_9HYPH|nr:hypothetical protein EOE48_04225 [Methylobacterium oryzihabitans]
MDRPAVAAQSPGDAKIGFAQAPRGLVIRNPEAIFRIPYHSRFSRRSTTRSDQNPARNSRVSASGS